MFIGACDVCGDAAVLANDVDVLVGEVHYFQASTSLVLGCC